MQLVKLDLPEPYLATRRRKGKVQYRYLTHPWRSTAQEAAADFQQHFTEFCKRK